jgi:hypothetical protein
VAKSICDGLCSACNSYVGHITKAATNSSFARHTRAPTSIATAPLFRPTAEKPRQATGLSSPFRSIERRQRGIAQADQITLSRARRIDDPLGHDLLNDQGLPGIVKFFACCIEGRTHDAVRGIVKDDFWDKCQN